MHGLYELTCRLCGTELNDYNWLPYLKRVRHRVCAPCWRKRDKIYQHRRNHSVKARLRAKRYNQRVKLKVVGHYSPSLGCQCTLGNCWHGNLPCPVTDIRSLSIDHIDGGGRRHLLELKRQGWSFYRWLIKQGYTIGFQVLCYNCNRVKAEVRGEFFRGFNPSVTGTSRIGT